MFAFPKPIAVALEAARMSARFVCDVPATRDTPARFECLLVDNATGDTVHKAYGSTKLDSLNKAFEGFDVAGFRDRNRYVPVGQVQSLQDQLAAAQAELERIRSAKPAAKAKESA